MNINKIYIKKTLFLLFLAMLSLPMVQIFFSFSKGKNLNGYYVKALDDSISIKGWWKGTYQLNKEKFVADSFGFRNDLIRVNNQIYFSLFNTARANTVIVGKENYLYEEPYINAYFGLDLKKEEKIIEKIYKLKKIQDTLRKLNKDILIVLAPSKASFFPEYIPDKYIKNNPLKTTNHTLYKKHLIEAGINLIDFDNYFKAIKNKSSYPLFPQYGTHYSMYGACLAADSIIHYLEKMRNVNLPYLYWNEIDSSKICRYQDDDISIALNLLYKPKTYTMAYPKYKFRTEGKQKRKILVVGDSFYDLMFEIGVSKNVFDNGEFWYYNKLIFSETEKEKIYLKTVNIKEHLESHDTVIILTSLPNMPSMGWGFVEKVYSIYYK